ncbi:hypothetical protein [Paenibacillus taichungensis]|uniref:hypothetical protein n=1 Tax=Paenibacillus taichungensis TaxID=484184 RepID=UPI0038D03D4E
MSKLIPLITAGLSAVIALGTFLGLHFLVEPRKEKRKHRFDRLHNLYSPLYALILARGYYVEGERSPEGGNVVLGTDPNHSFLSKDYTDNLMFEKSAYASNKLLDAWGKYVSSIGNVPDKVVENFVKSVVRDYNQIRKDLRLDYDKEELRTGLPKLFRDN